MIDLEFVERLIRALDESNLVSLELEQEGTRVHLSKGAPGHSFNVSNPGHASGNPVAAPPPTYPSDPGAGSSVAATAQAGEEEGGELEGLVEVVSPMVGTFYSAPSPDADPYVQVGERIGKGTVLCIIEAMKLMNELESEVAGKIAKILVENAQPVEYGQALFLIDPS
jgi:acetyl-CoA carboxylase biotin carboxyl carrier protein